MIVLMGNSIFQDICIGRIAFYGRQDRVVKRYHVEDTDAEIIRFNQAKEKGIEQLKVLHEKAQRDVGEMSAAIFEIHQLILADEELIQMVTNTIKSQKVNAEYAVEAATDIYASRFEGMEDIYMRGRAADIRDISERLLSILSNVEEPVQVFEEPVIIVAEDLSPSETMQLDKSKVLGFIMKQGSANSHTAILAKSMGIPAIMGVGGELNLKYDGRLCAVDGFSGMVYLDPDETTLVRMKGKKEESEKQEELLLSLRGKENITLDGTHVEISANIGTVEELDKVSFYDGDGIGLFRSEFLYLRGISYPTEEQQFQAYKRAAVEMGGKRVIIRTLDIGADKKADYFELKPEKNPAMGFRAIRICLTRPEIFITQLRAIYRASVYGQIAIMFPMIISLEEVKCIKAIVEDVKEDLKAEKILFREDVELGIMIETPAAALISDELAREVDFFSVGTNDLSQYTLAIDRQNEQLNRFYNPHHKAVLRMIKLAADNIHREGKWIGICGELGADTDLTEQFLRMGIDELSVTPSMILEVRKKVRSIDLK